MNDWFESCDKVSYTDLLKRESRLLELSSMRASPESWAKCEIETGVRFPPQYKALIEIFGFGTFGDVVRLLQPVAPQSNSLLNRVNLELNSSWFADLRERTPLYPEREGLVIVGSASAYHIVLALERCEFIDEVPMSDGGRLVLLDGTTIEHTQIQIDEFIYRTARNSPPLTGPLSGIMHEVFFHDRPLFVP